MMALVGVTQYNPKVEPHSNLDDIILHTKAHRRQAVSQAPDSLVATANRHAYAWVLGSGEASNRSIPGFLKGGDLGQMGEACHGLVAKCRGPP